MNHIMKGRCLLFISILMISQGNAQESDLYIRTTEHTSGAEIIQSSIGLDGGRYAILKSNSLALRGLGRLKARIRRLII